MKRVPRLSAGWLVALLAVVIGACTSATPSSRPLPSASASPQATPIPLTYGCAPKVARCQNIPAGTYTTAGQYAFLPGLTATIPAGWSSWEQDAGEFNLHQVSDQNANNVLYFWRDMAAVGADGLVAPGVGRTPADLVAFLTSDY